MVTRTGNPDLSELDVSPKKVTIRKKSGATLFDNDRTRAQTFREGLFVYGVLLFVLLLPKASCHNGYYFLDLDIFLISASDVISSCRAEPIK